MWNDELEALEVLVDRDGLRAVVDALAEVCRHKAEHLRDNCQDVASARIWDDFACKLESLARSGGVGT